MQANPAPDKQQGRRSVGCLKTRNLECATSELLPPRVGRVDWWSDLSAEARSAQAEAERRPGKRIVQQILPGAHALRYLLEDARGLRYSTLIPALRITSP